MKLSIMKGFSFGLTSGIITTLGLIIGLNSGTNDKTAVLGGILVIAIADAFSDALGIHISEESQKNKTQKQIWQSTIATFLTKFIFALSFAVPVYLFTLGTAMIVSIIWGLSLISIFSFFIAEKKGMARFHTIFEHLLIAVAVIIITHYVGEWVGMYLGWM